MLRSKIGRIGFSLVTSLVLFLGLSLAPASFVRGPSAEAITGEQELTELLISLGIDPTQAVFQEGLLNYAGPNCPGNNWNCVADTTKSIIQSAYDGGINVFECTLIEKCQVLQREKEEGGLVLAAAGLFSGTAYAKGQDKKAGINNVAHCIENPSGGKSANETRNCSITQDTPAGGKNVASVNMVLIQKAEGTTITGTQTATVTQTNESGDNTAKIKQKIKQDAATSAGGDPIGQTLEAKQSVILDQGTTSGANSGDVSQEQAQTTTATSDSGVITQSENAGSTDPDIFADLDQNSGSGAQDLSLSQVLNQTSNATSNTGDITQAQGSENGGLEGEIHQESTGVSTYSANQDENQNVSGSTGGTLTQTQIGPSICCIRFSQIGNDDNSCTIAQDSFQTGNEETDQSSTVETTFNTDGTCTANIHIQNDDAEFTDSFTGQTFAQTSNCTGGECSGGEEPEPEAGGAVAGGTGLRNREGGDIAISGIPAGATVVEAVLFWAVLYDSTVPPAGTITFEGTPLTADSGSISGELCWSDTNTIGYYKDVTSLVTGNGTYEVSDPPRGTTNLTDDPGGSLPFTDGASLIVLFSGGGANNQVLTNFDYDTNTDLDDSIGRSFTGISSVGGEASLILAGPDGQGDAGETFEFSGSGSFTLSGTWDGSDPQRGESFPIGNLWDTDEYDVGGVLPLGQTTFDFDHSLGEVGDCIGVGVAVLQVSQTTATPPVD